MMSHSRTALFGLLILGVLLSSIMLVSAAPDRGADMQIPQPPPPPEPTAVPPSPLASDGRINQIAHLGGAALYCVDQNFNPANRFDDGGIRLLDSDGQELLFVPAADIDAVGAAPSENTVLGVGESAFGPVTLYRLTSGEFHLSGFDEHGKLYAFVWQGCGPVGPAPSASAAAPVCPYNGFPTFDDLLAYCGCLEESGLALEAPFADYYQTFCRFRV
jgi:hypothetical protein